MRIILKIMFDVTPIIDVVFSPKIEGSSASWLMRLLYIREL